MTIPGIETLPECQLPVLRSKLLYGRGRTLLPAGTIR